jgi:hypothetical protein
MLDELTQALAPMPSGEIVPSILRDTLQQVAEEAAEAQARGLSLTAAAADEAAFPTLRRLHLGIRDVLTMSLPAPLAAWARELVSRPDPPIAEDLIRGLSQLAGDASSPPDARALARVLLHQAVRINLIVAEHLSGSSIAALGAAEEDVDRIAEAQVDRWLALGAEDTTGVRPLPVLVAAALAHLDAHLDNLKTALARLQDDLAVANRVRAELELKLRDMESSDAVLVKNTFAGEADDEPRISIEELQERHPLLLGERSRAALDQQVSRLRRRIASGEWPQRRGTALIDLIKEAEEAEDKDDDLPPR